MTPPRAKAPPGGHRRATRLAGLLQQAEQMMAAGRALLAGPLLDEAGELAPADATVQRLRAVRAILLGDAAAAVAAARQGTELAPTQAAAWMVRGRAHKLAGALDEAIEAYRRAVNLDPELAEVHVSLGIAFKLQGRISDAIACYRRALDINPRLAAAHANLGNALILQRDAASEDTLLDDDADAAQRRAVELDPKSAQARANWARSLDRAGRGEKAVELLNSALALEPGSEPICNALVGVLHKLRWYEGARELLEKWLPANPQCRPSTVNSLATTLLHLGRYSDALAWARKAEAQAPDDTDVLFNIGCALVHRLQQTESLALFRRVVQAAPHHTVARESLVMCLNYAETDPHAIVAEHRAFGAAITQPAPADAPPLPPLQPKRRLRIAYLSGDLRRHSVGYFVEPLFEGHDHERVEVFAYHNNPYADEVTERLKAHTQHWVSCAAMSDDTLLRRIRSDGIDVLIDLSGATADGRPEMLARRAAPMQVSYLGYPTTTGIPAMDFRVSDALIDPDGDEDLSTEALLRLPASMFCYRPDGEVALGQPPLLHTGFVTFGSFNNLAKFSDAALALWAAVLKAVPRSRLLLKTRALGEPQAQRIVHERLERLGIARERVLLNPWRPDLRSHLEVYQEVDIGLDTFPYNGATTTCEALWSGVPVITLRGRTHASRMGASILTAIGRAEWVADSPEDFVVRAVSLAADPQRLQAFRAGARDTLRRSPLMDGRRFARDFEDLLFQGWHQCCEAHARGTDPAAAEAALAEGHARSARADAEGALLAYEQALAIAPRHLLAAWGVARMRAHLGRTAAAIEALQQVLALDPGAAPAWALLGDMQEFQGEVQASAASFDRALSLAPSPALRWRRALLLPSVLPHGCDLPALRAEHQRQLEALVADPPPLSDPLLEVHAAPVNQRFRLAYHGLDNRRLHELYARALLAACPGLAWVAPHCRAGALRRPGPIRVGFISRFFRQHSIGKTSVGLIEALARPEFHATVLFLPPRSDDAMARRIAAAADAVLDLPADLAASREAIAALELDILFYQDIGMEPQSYYLAFARLAPRQCLSYGHPETSGIPTLDAWISADSIEAPGAELHYSETLYRIPQVGTLACYDRPLLRPEDSVTRAGFGLPEQVPLLACPQALFKFHPDMDELIAAVLKRLPQARLLLVRGDVPAYQDQLMARWRARGDGIDRAAVFFPPLAHGSFLSLLALADVVLDPVHFNGQNSSLEALSLGAPLVTLPTGLQRGRHTLGMYLRMGYTELVAADAAAYVDLVVRLVEDGDFNARARQAILARCGVLFRDLAVVRGFEAVLRRLHQDAQADRMPAAAGSTEAAPLEPA